MMPPNLPPLEPLPTAMESRRSGYGDGGSGVSVAIAVPGLPSAIPGLPPGMPMPQRVPAGYMQSRGGVEAEVKLNGQDADIMTRMGSLAALCHVMATDMNRFQGMMPSTRSLIKSLRNLASELQEEVEVRCGPQGPLHSG